MHHHEQCKYSVLIEMGGHERTQTTSDKYGPLLTIHSILSDITGANDTEARSFSHSSD